MNDIRQIVEQDFPDFELEKSIGEGGSPVRKYILKKNNNKYLLRLYNPKFFNSRIEALENHIELSKNGISVPKVFNYGFLNCNDEAFALLEWVEGISLDNLLSHENEFFYGESVALELKKIHKTNLKSECDLSESFLKKIKNKISKLEGLGINLNECNIVLEYIEKNINVLKNRDLSLIHGDLYPQNVVELNSGNLCFIDLDMCKEYDPWFDLSANTCLQINDRYHYSLIYNYFDGDIPEDFWLIYNMYGCYYCIDYLFYTQRSNSHKITDGIETLKRFLSQTQNFKNSIPYWFMREQKQKRR